MGAHPHSPADAALARLIAHASGRLRQRIRILSPDDAFIVLSTLILYGPANPGTKDNMLNLKRQVLANLRCQNITRLAHQCGHAADCGRVLKIKPSGVDQHQRTIIIWSYNRSVATKVSDTPTHRPSGISLAVSAHTAPRHHPRRCQSDPEQPATPRRFIDATIPVTQNGPTVKSMVMAEGNRTLKLENRVSMVQMSA